MKRKGKKTLQTSGVSSCLFWLLLVFKDSEYIQDHSAIVNLSSLSHVKSAPRKTDYLGLSWRSSGYDSVLPMHGVQVWSLVREDTACRSAWAKKKKKWKKNDYWAFTDTFNYKTYSFRYELVTHSKWAVSHLGIVLDFWNSHSVKCINNLCLIIFCV